MNEGGRLLQSKVSRFYCFAFQNSLLPRSAQSNPTDSESSNKAKNTNVSSTSTYMYRYRYGIVTPYYPSLFILPGYQSCVLLLKVALVIFPSLQTMWLYGTDHAACLQHYYGQKKCTRFRLTFSLILTFKGATARILLIMSSAHIAKKIFRSLKRIGCLLEFSFVFVAAFLSFLPF